MKTGTLSDSLTRDGDARRSPRTRRAHHLPLVVVVGMETLQEDLPVSSQQMRARPVTSSRL